MTVDEKTWSPRPARLGRRGLSQDNRVALGFAESNVQAYFPAMIYDPFGASHHILLMLRLRRHTGKANILGQLFDGLVFVPFEVVENSLHRQLFSRTSSKTKPKTGRDLGGSRPVLFLFGTQELVQDRSSRVLIGGRRIGGRLAMTAQHIAKTLNEAAALLVHAGYFATPLL